MRYLARRVVSFLSMPLHRTPANYSAMHELPGQSGPMQKTARRTSATVALKWTDNVSKGACSRRRPLDDEYFCRGEGEKAEEKKGKMKEIEKGKFEGRMSDWLARGVDADCRTVVARRWVERNREEEHRLRPLLTAWRDPRMFPKTTKRRDDDASRWWKKIRGCGGDWGNRGKRGEWGAQVVIFMTGLVGG